MIFFLLIVWIRSRMRGGCYFVCLLYICRYFPRWMPSWNDSIYSMEYIRIDFVTWCDQGFFLTLPCGFNNIQFSVACLLVSALLTERKRSIGSNRWWCAEKFSSYLDSLFVFLSNIPAPAEKRCFLCHAQLCILSEHAGLIFPRTGRFFLN